MKWLNAQGQPIVAQPMTIQLDVPCEPVGDELTTNGTINIVTIIIAVIGLFAALKSGDPTAIAAALQALINAFMGK